jgi:hypothetical protein
LDPSSFGLEPLELLKYHCLALAFPICNPSLPFFLAFYLKAVPLQGTRLTVPCSWLHRLQHST